MSFVNVTLTEQCLATGSDNYNYLQHYKHDSRHLSIQTRIA